VTYVKQELSSFGSTEAQPGIASTRDVNKRDVVSVCISSNNFQWSEVLSVLFYALADKISI
jgi:hypothetical protein